MSRRQFLVMLMVVPLFLPFFFSASFLLIKSTDLRAALLDIQDEYSMALSDQRINQIAQATFKVDKSESIQEVYHSVSPRDWLFIPRKSTEPPLKMAFEREVKTKSVPVAPSTSSPSPIVSTHLKSSGPIVNTQININLETKNYVGYAEVSGIILFPISDPNLTVEVSFFDRLSDNGIDDEFSTTLVSQSFEAYRQTFSLRLPIESQGFLVAKAYEGDNKEPVFIGAPEINPITVSKEGLHDIAIHMISKDTFFKENETLFSGKVVSEYNANQCLNRLRVWVQETRDYAETGDDCSFSFRGLRVEMTYQFIFEREGFVTQSFEVHMDEKQKQQTFILSPESKYVNGYDVFLGERDPQKSVLFATVRHKGKPVQQGVAKSSRPGTVVYIRKQDDFNVPDKNLYSMDQSGEFVLWNAIRGKHSIQVFKDGELLGAKTVKLFPGVVQTVVLDF